MLRDRRVRIYDLHSWTGITMGLFVFVISFTGCLALFYHELQTWSDPAHRLGVAETRAPVHDRLSAWIEAEFGTADHVFVGFQYPSEREPYYRADVAASYHEGGFRQVTRRWDPDDGTPLPDRQDGLATWLLDFHRDLMWPEALGGRTVGRMLVGIAGIVLMLSIITGLITHRKMLRELFKLRYQRSVRVKWKDTHNVLGLWALPFHVMIAYTGAWLGVVALMVPLVAALTLDGDTDRLAEELGIGGPEAAGQQAEMFSLDAVGRMAHPETGRLPAHVSVSEWGDRNALFQVNYEPETELLIYESIYVQGASGEVLAAPDSGLNPSTATGRIIGAIAPLHYATFGGIWLKLLYFVLGLALSAMVVFGNMVWLERRRHGSTGSRSDRFYHRLGQLTAGVCLGVVAASVAVFYVERLYAGDESARLFWIGAVYFAIWLSVTLAAFAIRNLYRGVRFGTAAIGVAVLGLPLLDSILIGQPFVAEFGSGHTAAAWVNAALLVTGAACIATAFGMPDRRPAERRRRRRAGRADGGPATATASSMAARSSPDA
jgi:uncharacterized iron-regulated membrane protein